MDQHIRISEIDRQEEKGIFVKLAHANMPLRNSAILCVLTYN